MLYDMLALKSPIFDVCKRYTKSAIAGFYKRLQGEFIST
jgi:hypothetical protein